MLLSLRHSWRSWKREKGVALLAISALAIGIGCATAVFTVVYAVLLEPLPYAQPDRWIQLFGGIKNKPDDTSGLSIAELLAFKQRSSSVEHFGWFPVGGDYNLTAPGQPRHIDGIPITPSLLAQTGMAPATGRFFTVSDGPNVAVISHRLLKQLGPDILGRNITLNRRSYLVLGVAAPSFQLPLFSIFGRNTNNDVWVPLETPRDEGSLKNANFYTAYAKLKPGITFEQARVELRQVAVQIQKESRPEDPNFTAKLISLRDSVVHESRPLLLVLLGAAALLFLVACANVSGLLISRSVSRAHETAVRIAIGGGRTQLAGQYFLESFLVSTIASLIGVLGSMVLVRLVVTAAAEYIPRSDQIATNWPVIGFAVTSAFVTAGLSTLAPLAQALRTQPNEILSQGVRVSAGTRSRRLSRSLVVGEMALAFTLIAVSALLLWHVRQLRSESPGFDPGGLLRFEITRQTDAGEKLEVTSAYIDKILLALEAIPGITSAAFANQVPLAGCCFSTAIFPEGIYQPGEPGREVSFMVVSASYFKTMGIRLLSGRFLVPSDKDVKIAPAILDDVAAKRYWPGQNALGRTARIRGSSGDRFQVVGIVGGVRNQGLGEDPRPEIFFLKEMATPIALQFLVRSPLPLATLTNTVRQVVGRVDPSAPIHGTASMYSTIDASLTFPDLASMVVSVFALAALLLVCLGVYGLTSYSVRQRTTEIGTRMAIGAVGSDVLRLVLKESLRLTVYGLLAGAFTTAGATFLVMRYLKVQVLSPWPYILAVAVVLVLALLASAVPGWRASLLSPMVAIRNDTDTVWSAARRSVEQVRERFARNELVVPIDATVLASFIEASRRAESFAQVLDLSLQEIQGSLHAQSVRLLERAKDRYRDRRDDSVDIPASGYVIGRLQRYSAPLPFSAADLETALRWAREHRPSYIAELETLQSIGLRLGVALRSRNEIFGLLFLGEPTSREEYSDADKKLLAACAPQLALMLENGRLTERMLEQEKINRDIALAMEVQRRLLPASSPAIHGSALDAFTLAARSVGGDYYDFLQIGEHRLGIALADIAGKGIAAALIMAVVQASLRIVASEGNISLPELAARMNRFLHRSTGSSSYATFFYAQLDEEKRQLRYVNAGHNPPYLVRYSPDGTAPIEELSAGGMIIGMFPSATYEESVVDLQPGDLLIAFTDGVTEALNPAEEEFGEERLQQLLRRVAALPIAEITAAISQELSTWIAGAPQYDDITFVVLKVDQAA